MRLTLLVLMFTVLGNNSVADEIRPGYLSISEQSEGVYSILWKQPENQGTPPLGLQLPAICINKTKANTKSIRGALISRWMVACVGGIKGEHISIDGLASSGTDVLVQVQWLNESSNSARLTPSSNVYQVPATTESWEIVTSYFLFGVEHILVGADHLLFVFALLLIVTSTRRLIITITSFTLAHSITLAASTLNLVSLPQQPIEASIALSIMFLAAEIIHTQRGHPGAAARWPWLIAFTFGLLHGFGFAGALSELGLPENAIPLALIFFNVGVEAGQLIFVGGVIILGSLIRRFTEPSLIQQSQAIVVYGIGALASFWMIERVAAF